MPPTGTQAVILVTGAAGKTGRAVLTAMAKRDLAGRGFVRAESYRQIARDAGAAEAAVGDMRDAEALERAMEGARAVYHIPPNMHSEEVLIGRGVLRAAAEAGADHFVYHSVLHPQIEAMPHHWRKLQVEELVLESGLAFTVLQPAAYMQNTVGSWEDVADRGIYEIPYPTHTRLAMIDLADVGEAAAAVLSTDRHHGAIYELVGEPGLSMDQVAEHMSRALGRVVRAEQIPHESWVERARAGGIHEERLEDFLAMFEHYAAHHFVGNPNTLQNILGRAPRGYSQFIEKHVQSGG